MSFFINNPNPCKPCGIAGNPTSGICEKVCIETKKIFDACVSQTTELGLILNLSNFTPANPTYPLTFVSASSVQTDPATISNVTIDRIDCRPNFANVGATVTIPIIVHYLDANRIPGTANATITVDKSVILFVPQPSITPINIEAFASFTSTQGSFPSTTTVNLNGCLQIILKVVAIVDILIPSYGYPSIPPCHAPSPNEACAGVFDLPLYPTATNQR